MVFKLVEGAQKNWRRIDGHNQLPKLLQGVRFNDGIEVIGNSAAPQAQAAASSFRPSPKFGVSSRQVMRDYSVDPRRVYVAGLSAGAAAAVIMGITYPDLYAAIGAHSGLACGAASDVPSAFAVMRQGEVAAARRSGSAPGDGEYWRIVPTIVFHGDQDKTVHPRNGDQIIAQARAKTTTELQARMQHGRVLGGHAYSRTLHADASGQAVLEQWVIHG